MNEFIRSAPQKPGVYVFRDEKGVVLYVGKAKNIKNRMKQYFAGKPSENKTQVLVETVAHVDFFVTNNELEALILENHWIKKHQPPFNVMLKDSVHYPWIKFTNEEFSRLEIERLPKRALDKKSGYLGPFTDFRARKRTLYLVNNALKLRTCDPLPKRVCLRYHLKQCTAPCVGKVSPEEYAKQVEFAKLFYEGKGDKLVEILSEEMKLFSQAKAYEMALERRNMIRGIEGAQSEQHIEVIENQNRDAWAFRENDAGFVFELLQTRRGTLLGKKEFALARGVFDNDPLSEFVQGYYAEHEIPHEVLLPHVVPNSSALEKTFSAQSGRKVSIGSPSKGRGAKLLRLARENLELLSPGSESALRELQNALILAHVPRHIECFDVSHLGGRFNVAASVAFFDGRPDKKNYRQYRLQKVQRNDDYASMQEVVGRRLARLQKENRNLPDLLIVDGGKGQLSAAVQVLSDLGVRVPVAGLAKKNEELFVPARETPLVFPKGSPVFQLITQIRDEAHRFANRYRKKRVEMGLRKPKP